MFRKLKWLQWSPADLTSGLGGVEEHARCVARELRALGVDAHLSRDPAELSSPKWDVIHFHGGGGAPVRTSAVRVHTLHGTTFGRMAACGEWFWPGGYLAEMKEVAGVFRSQVELSVHPQLSLFRMARKLGKLSAYCGNGWDSGLDSTERRTPVSSELISKIDRKRPLWLYVGRGEDFVKGSDRIRDFLRFSTQIQLLAVPGSGFGPEDRVIKSGQMDSGQVRSLLEIADGLIVPSRYEGNSLVVLEALASGVRVLSTAVGAVNSLPAGVLGLEVLRTAEPQSLHESITRIEGSLGDSKTRTNRIQTNRALLPRWKDVAKIAYDLVLEFQARGRTL